MQIPSQKWQAELNAAESEIARLERVHGLYSECTRLLLRTRTESNLINGFCRLIVDVAGYPFSSVHLVVDEDSLRLEKIASAGASDRSPDDVAIGSGIQSPTQCLSRAAVRECRTQICADTQSDPRFMQWQAAANEHEYASSASFPITLDSRCIGCLNIYASRKHAFDRREVALLVELMHDLAYGLSALRAHEDGRRARSQAELFRTLLQNTTEMIYIVESKSGRIVDANQSTIEKLGYSRSELLSSKMIDFSLRAAERPWAERVQHLKNVGALISEEQYRTRDGRVIPVEVSLRFIERFRAEYVIVLTRDITERQNQLAQIERLARILRMQSGINSAVLRMQDRADLLQEACRLATDVGGYDRAVLFVVTDDGMQAMPTYRAGRGTDLPEPSVITIGDGSSPDESLSGRALRTRKPAVSPDLGQPDPPVAMREWIVRRGYRAMVALPLIVEGRTEAVMTLASRDRQLVADDEFLLLLEDMMANLSFAMSSKRQAEKVQFLATYDSLTGLPRRARFIEELDKVLSANELPHAQFSVVALDIQGLNRINDTFGRHFGDLLLQQVATRIKRYARGNPVGHPGGGTFLIVEPTVDGGTGGLRSVLDTNLFSKPVPVEERGVPISSHYGIAYYPADGANGSRLVQCAEAALKEAKDSGEGCLSYRMEMHSAIVRRLDLEHRLRSALTERQFALYYQAQVDAASNEVVSLEALLRWNDPERGVITPGDFLAVLESTGMIMEVGDWVLERAADDCARWRGLGSAPLRIAVNVSGVQLRQLSFADRVLQLHARMSAHGGCGLELEITESTLLRDIPGITAMLRDLRDSGIRIALDDFGTGYSSLSLLSRLPVDVLKLDRSFISGVPHESASVALVENVLRLAKALRLTTVVEGVETVEQLDALRVLGCDKWQGYLHGRPAPAEEIKLMMNRAGNKISCDA